MAPRSLASLSSRLPHVPHALFCVSFLLLLLVALLPAVHAHEPGDEGAADQGTGQAALSAHEGGMMQDDPSSLAGVREELANRRAQSTDLGVILPLRYFAQGEWLLGIIVVALWVVVLRAFYLLVLMVLARA